MLAWKEVGPTSVFTQRVTVVTGELLFQSVGHDTGNRNKKNKNTDKSINIECLVLHTECIFLTFTLFHLSFHIQMFSEYELEKEVHSEEKQSEEVKTPAILIAEIFCC